MNLINGTELNAWRTLHKLTLNEVGDLLGEVTGPTVSRWENGQDIPGPVQKLLAWLIKGIEPFDRATAPQHVKEALWRVEMNLGAWERLEVLRSTAGYATLSDWIAAMLRDELRESAQANVVADGAAAGGGGRAEGGGGWHACGAGNAAGGGLSQQARKDEARMIHQHAEA